MVSDALAADQLVRAGRSADKAAITAARLFDLYPGQVLSLAVEVTLQPGEKSFTEADIPRFREDRCRRREVGATLRS